MLLVGAGLLIRSYVQLQHVEPGFESEGVTTFSLSLPAARYADPASPRAFVSALLSRLEAEPGVQSAAVAMGLPFTSDLNAITGFRHEGQPEPDLGPRLDPRQPVQSFSDGHVPVVFIVAARVAACRRDIHHAQVTVGIDSDGCIRL